MRKAFQKCVNNEILSMHYWKYNSICYIWNTRQIWHKTAMKSTWKENNTHSVHQRRFPPHHRPSQSTPAWPSEKSSICSQVTSVRPHHSVNKQKQLFLLTDWTANCFLCTCSFWGSPGTRGPLWPAHLDSLLPLSPDSSHGRRNRVCRHSSRRCQ